MIESMELLVQISIAIGTIGAVLVALFRDNLRLLFAPPKLSLKILDAGGYKTKVQLNNPDSEDHIPSVEAPARYYHLLVKNNRRWSTAHQVQVFITRIESPGPDGLLQVDWAGELPLRWRYQESYPITRTLGANAECDLCNIIKGQGLQLMPLIRPNEFPKIWQEKANLVLSLQARSVETDSAVLRVNIDWNGDWEDGQLEMKKHMIIKESK